MGFRNPYRIQVDENDVAYITDYSPDSNVPENFRGPAGTGRVEIVRKPSNYGWPLCYSPDLPYYQWNFNTSRPLTQTHPVTLRVRQPDARPAEHARAGYQRRPERRARPRVRAADRPAGHLVLVPRQHAGLALGTPCLGVLRRLRARTTCPRLFPELFTGGVAPHGAAKYEYNPANPNTKKFPPYYDESVFLGRVQPGHAARGPARLAEQDLQDQPAAQLRRGAASPRAPFECDNPKDMQFGADGAFYLLTYGDGFFAANADAGMYKWDYVKGQRAPERRAQRRPDRRRRAADGAVHRDGTVDADPGDATRRYEWDFDDNGTVDATDAEPDAHLHDQRRLHGEAHRDGLQRARPTSKSTVITVGNTSPTITITVPTDGDFFEWGDGSRTRSRSPTRRTRRSTAPRSR